ncbi:efflux RND transporter permease subunit [Cupriavidus sp. H39]|uniref:efflux RND transporter permease subunit n=1 Tax=Cupriavidus sp. H39 TaxID=3401635 RepID=UPI003D069D6E
MIGPNLSEWAIKNRPLVVFLMIVAIVTGALSFLRLGRAEDPAFTVRTMVVSAAWPGATIEETLLQVTERIERKLQETPHLDRIRSYTTAGSATIFVDLEGATPPARIPDLWYQVRKNIGDIRGALPGGVIGPAFNDDFGETYGIIFGFTAEGFSQRELRDYVENARSRLLNVRDISKIEILGAQDEQIFIEFSTERLATLGLDYSTLIAALQAQNVVRPAGVLQAGNERMFLRVTGAFDNEEDIRGVNFVVDGRNIRLGDIAQVRRAYDDPPQTLFRVNGKPAIGLAIAMREGGDILALGRNVRQEMKSIRANLPYGIEPILVADQAQTVDTAIGDFVTSLWQAIVIILIVSFVSLGVRPGAVVALAIPLTLAIVFAVMQIAGIDLQRISLGALIIALTLLVDDAMTTVDAMIRRLAAGDTMVTAATFAYRTLAAPMLAGTLITISGFVPIGFAKSSAGEYTSSIFAVVAIALIVSWLVAVIFAPLIGVAALRAPKPDARDAAEPGRLLRAFNKLLLWALGARWLVIALTLGIFVAATVLMRFVPSQFFPSSDRPELIVDLTLRQNASIYASDEMARTLEAFVAKDGDIDHWSTYVGRGAIRFYLPLNVQLPNPFFSQLVLVTKDVNARNRVQERLEKLLAEQFPEVVAKVSPLELGPAVGWPLQWRVSGPDKDEVARIAQNVAQVIASNADVRNLNYDWIEPARQLRIKVDQEQAGRLGVSSASISGALHAAATGTPVTQLRDNIYLVNVVARATEAERGAVSTLRALQVPIPGGRTVPLSQFATFEYEQEYPLVWRRNRVLTLSVRADVRHGVLPDTVVTALEPQLNALGATLAKPYRIELGGIAEESAASSASVFAVVPLMLLLMLTILMIAVRSFGRLAIVLVLLPLGLIGVVLALLVSGRPLGFVAMLGILSLLGMIAKNAVILIVQIEGDRAEGLGVRDAVLQASRSRLRPLMLTAISTVLGLIPIAPTVFWGPMAFAIMGGLLVATLLTLIFLPTVYVTVFGDEDNR